MEKEKILEMARKENAKVDLIEEQIRINVGHFAFIVGGALCMLLMLLTNLLQGKSELSGAIIYLGMTSAGLFTRHRMSHSKKAFWGGILLGTLTVTGIVIYLIRLLGVA